MMNKHGSLELSANAIVILIIAITILGLGLGFVRNLFGSLAEKIGLEAENIDFSEPPTAIRPITMVKNMELAKGKQMKLKIGFFNNKNCGEDKKDIEYVPMFKNCVGSKGSWCPTDNNYADCPKLPTVTAAPTKLGCGKTTEFSSIITGQSTMDSGESVCTIEIQDSLCETNPSKCLLDEVTSLQIFVNVP